MEKLDFKKKLKELYQPTHKDFSVVTVPDMLFAMIDGEGAPEGENFAQSVKWLYSTIYPIKFAAKKKMGKDFVMAPLEGLWWADDMDDFIKGNRNKWKWRLMIVLPEWTSEQMFEEGVVKGEEKLGKRPESLRLEMFEEGLAVQIMHIGPFADEAPVIARMHQDFLPANGFVENGYHHEIYLNDARRTAPEKLKTVLRQPVRKA
ncbi:MAG TPA: hypothetical protein ENJ90_11705 [Devosia sp.]|nr:hypothetical protein [Devosia sp.]